MICSFTDAAQEFSFTQAPRELFDMILLEALYAFTDSCYCEAATDTCIKERIIP